MILSCDVGSLPQKDEQDKLLEEATHFAANHETEAAVHFEQAIVSAFLDKLKAGISIPTFPQFRDMNAMFLSTSQGIERTKNGYIETDRLTLKAGMEKLPEIAAIERNSKTIHDQTSSFFRLKLCITGPYTLASFFSYRNSQIYGRLGEMLSEIVERNLFADKHGEVTFVFIDEPLFGLIDDPLIDRGSEGRESLLATWESIAQRAKNRGVEVGMHLHCTSDELFWAVKPLRIIESHLNDPLYEMKTTKEHLQRKDKLLKASIATSDFDQLIKEKLETKSDDDVAQVWKNIKKGRARTETFLENTNVMKKRLKKMVEQFGEERLALAGPECGLRGFPTYSSALECLSRTAKAVDLVNKELS